MPATYQEFLNENAYRRYPLKDEVSAIDSSGVFTIPNSLIVDVQLCAPSTSLANGKFYVSSLVIRRYTIDVGISYKPTAALAFAVGYFLNIDTTAGTNISYSFVPLPQDQIANQFFSDMSGTIAIGSCEAAISFAGSWEFDPDNAEFNSSTIDEGLTQLRSVQVGNQKFYGNLILKEGTNVVLSPVYDAGTDTTTITMSARLEGSASNINLENDADIIAAMVALYGQPIQTINNLMSDSSGNFTLAPADCVSFTPSIDHGISISNPCSQPCCEGTYLDAAYTALSQLNVRYARIVDFYTSATTNIDQIQQKLALLEAQTGYF